MASSVRRIVHGFLVAGLVAVVASSSFAGSISAVASGSPSPTVTHTVSGTDTLSNGDFVIATLNPVPSPLGDGEDDWTTWFFDFTADPGYAIFPTSSTLASAMLTLTLTPGDGLVASDQVWMGSLAAINASKIQNLTVAGGTKTVTLDLLDFYSSIAILGVLTGTGGLVPMTYQDDAIVSYARLDLTTTVPLPPAAPAGIALLALVGALRRVRRRKVL